MMEPEDKTQEIAERAERLQEIGSSILRAARDELYLGMRFLDVALSSFSYQMDGQIHGFGTDGRVMYFQPQMLGGLYRENRILVNRGYLHMVFHCIFRHFAWRGTEGKKRADDGITIQERMRDLSCDIADRAMSGMARKLRKNVNRAMNLLNEYQQDKFDKVQRKETDVFCSTCSSVAFTSS